MPGVSSADAADRSACAASDGDRRAGRGAVPLSARARAAMIACGFVPILHALGVLTPLALIAAGRAGAGALWVAPLILYLVPALVVGTAVRVHPIARGAVPAGSPAFLWWWFTAQWQVLFARLPFLEELLRLVPGLYSTWLRLWGARVGGLVYWSPGVSVTDRSLLRVGDRVVFGMGARLNAHVVAPDAHDRPCLYVAPIEVGSDAIVGGYSLLLPGCAIAPGEASPPLKTVHAFTRWAGGRRARSESPDAAAREARP